jgi:hypothetical protein
MTSLLHSKTPQIKIMIYFFLCFVVTSASQCPEKINKEALAKIQFDYSALDENGLYRGERSLDYEFCIPATETNRKTILDYEPDTRIMEKSKGRIGCKEGQWLCIVSTHDPEWKERLYKIASLSYVDRIIETVYE